jgi:hypothetical protein
MYQIKKQIWRAVGIEEEKAVALTREGACEQYLRWLHRSDTTCCLFKNLETGCGCWPERGPCEHERGEIDAIRREK